MTTANRLFRTARGLDIGGVKIYYGLGEPAAQTDLPIASEIPGAFYFDGLTGVTWFNNASIWTIAGGGSAQYVGFDNSVAQLTGSPAIETVQAAIEALAAAIGSVSQSADGIRFNNTTANLPGSPEPLTVQDALDVMDSLVDNLIARVQLLEETPPGSATAATTSFDNSVAQIPGSPAIDNVQTALEYLAANGGGGGTGIPVEDWNVTPTAETITVVDSQNATYNVNTKTLTADWSALSPGGLGFSIIKTNITAANLISDSGMYLSLELNETPTAVVQSYIVGLAPAAASVGDIETQLLNVFTANPLTPPFLFVFGGGAGSGIVSNVIGSVVTDSQPTGSSFNVQVGVNTTKVDITTMTAGDIVGAYLTKLTTASPDAINISGYFVDAGTGAYDLGATATGTDNPVLPTDMVLFFALATQDTGSGYIAMSLKTTIQSTSGVSVTDTTYETNGGTQASWNAEHPYTFNPIIDYTQATFPLDVATNKLYRAVVDVGYSGPTIAPYGISVTDDQVLIVDDIGGGSPSTASFRVLPDKAYVDSSVSSASSAKGGEIIFFIADPSYALPNYFVTDEFTGSTVYTDIDSAYAEAITYPKHVKKVFVFDNRVAQRTINSSGTLDLAANNIWLSSYTLWNSVKYSASSSLQGYATLLEFKMNGLLVDKGYFGVQSLTLVAPLILTGPIFVGDDSRVDLGFGAISLSTVANRLDCGRNSTLAIIWPLASTTLYIYADDNCTIDGGIFCSSFGGVELNAPRNCSANDTSPFGVLNGGTVTYTRKYTDLGTENDGVWGDLTSASGWNTYWGGTFDYRKIGHKVFLRFSVVNSTTFGAGLGQLPTGFRPSSNSYFAVIGGATVDAGLGTMYIDTSGNVSVNISGGPDYYVSGYIEFEVD